MVVVVVVQKLKKSDEGTGMWCWRVGGDGDARIKKSGDGLGMWW